MPVPSPGHAHPTHRSAGWRCCQLISCTQPYTHSKPIEASVDGALIDGMSSLPAPQRPHFGSRTARSSPAVRISRSRPIICFSASLSGPSTHPHPAEKPPPRTGPTAATQRTPQQQSRLGHTPARSPLPQHPPSVQIGQIHNTHHNRWRLLSHTIKHTTQRQRHRHQRTNISRQILPGPQPQLTKPALARTGQRHVQRHLIQMAEPIGHRSIKQLAARMRMPPANHRAHLNTQPQPATPPTGRPARPDQPPPARTALPWL